MVGIYLPFEWSGQHKLDHVASQCNPVLKPSCVLYSCSDEQTGRGGHFSALTTTEGMWPEPGLVPLQQWDGVQPGQLPPPSLARSTQPVSLSLKPGDPPEHIDLGSPALPLLPVRFLLPDNHGRVAYFLNKHMEVVRTSCGHWYARYPLNKVSVSHVSHPHAAAH